MRKLVVSVDHRFEDFRKKGGFPKQLRVAVGEHLCDLALF